MRCELVDAAFSKIAGFLADARAVSTEHTISGPRRGATLSVRARDRARTRSSLTRSWRGPPPSQRVPMRRSASTMTADESSTSISSSSRCTTSMRRGFLTSAAVPVAVQAVSDGEASSWTAISVASTASGEPVFDFEPFAPAEVSHRPRSGSLRWPCRFAGDAVALAGSGSPGRDTGAGGCWSCIRMAASSGYPFRRILSVLR